MAEIEYPAIVPAMIGDDAETAIAEASKKYNNWSRFGKEDRKGCINFIDEAKRREAAACVKTGRSISCGLKFDADGPQNSGRLPRTNPLHVMYLSGADSKKVEARLGHGISFADDGVTMALQCGTQWDGLGHCFDHGVAYNGVPSHEAVDSFGDHSTGIERVQSDMVTRGVLLDVGRVCGQAFKGVQGVLPDGFAITEEHILKTIKQQGPTSEVRKGDIVLVRTGQMGARLKYGWGKYAGGDAPGLSFKSIDWMWRTQIAAIATDTWGFEVRPNEFPKAFQPCHQVLLPNMGLMIGEIWNMEALADDCAQDKTYEFLLVAAPLPFTGAVGAPLNPIAIK